MAPQLPMAILGLAVAACTDIPEPDPFEPPPLTDVTPTVGEPPVPYAGPCIELGDLINRGDTQHFVVAGDVGGIVDFTMFRFNTPEDPTVSRIEMYTVGHPAELRGVVQSFGAGANAELTTCVHCPLIYRDCAENGYDCQSGPYFPRRGRSVSDQVAEGVGDANGFDFLDVELVRVSLDDELAMTVQSGDDDCLHLGRTIISGQAEAWQSGCDVGMACTFASTAHDRHPSPDMNKSSGGE